MPPKRTRAAAAGRQAKTSTVPAALVGKKLKIVLSSSSSSEKVTQDASLPKVSRRGRPPKSVTQAKKAIKQEEQSEEDLEMSEAEEEELDLESSPVKVAMPPSPKKSAGKIQLKLSLSKSPEPSSSSGTFEEDEDEDDVDIDLEDDFDDEEVGEEDNFDEDSLGEPEEVLPRKMTKRQKAMLEYNSASAYDEVPVGTKISTASLKEKGEITEEEALKRAEQTRRRQAQRDLKMEESKQATINRLLQKHGARSKKMKASQQANTQEATESLSPSASPVTNPSPVTSFIDAPVPEKGLRYQSTPDGSVLIITDMAAYEQVFRSASAPSITKPVHCAASGCRGLKKYVEPHTSKPVCSLECYRKIVS